MAHIYAGFSALVCPLLHRIAFPVVSEWCQYHPPIYSVQGEAHLLQPGCWSNGERNCG